MKCKNKWIYSRTNNNNNTTTTTTPTTPTTTTTTTTTTQQQQHYKLKRWGYHPASRQCFIIFMSYQGKKSLSTITLMAQDCTLRTRGLHQSHLSMS